MEDLLMVFVSYLVIGLTVTASVSTIVAIFKPYIDLQKYSLTISAVLSIAIFVAYNRGILTALGIPQDFSIQPLFHFVDLGLTAIIGTLGAQGFHKLMEGIKEYTRNKS